MEQRTDFHRIAGIHRLTAVATNPPGFTLDEPVEELGQSLRLPRWLEFRRRDIQETLPPLGSAPVALP